jgi:hypothetical protein
MLKKKVNWFVRVVLSFYYDIYLILFVLRVMLTGAPRALVKDAQKRKFYIDNKTFRLSTSRLHKLQSYITIFVSLNNALGALFNIFPVLIYTSNT